MKIVLKKEEIAKAVAEYVAKRLGQSYMKASVRFETDGLAELAAEVVTEEEPAPAGDGGERG